MSKGRKKILLIGPMPVPPGGVSTHLSRLLLLSKDVKDLQISVLDIRKRRWYGMHGESGNWFRIFFEFLTAHCIHIHISKPVKATLGRIVKILGKKLFYTQHNLRDLKKQSTLRIMRYADKIIFVQQAPELPEFIQKKAIVIPAYLPSLQEHPVPEWFEKEIQNHPNVLLSLAFHEPDRPTLFEGKDLYGFDQIIETIISIHQKKSLRDWMIMLIDPNGTMASIYAKKMADIEEQTGIRMIFFGKPFDVLSVMPHCKMYLRSTWSDGDALSLREALASGIPAVASDCVERPAGTIVYKTGDAEDMKEKVLAVMENPYRITFQQPDFSLNLFDLYRSV